MLQYQEEFPVQNATLTIMVGGKKASFNKAINIFKALGENIIYVGKVAQDK